MSAITRRLYAHVRPAFSTSRGSLQSSPITACRRSYAKRAGTIGGKRGQAAMLGEEEQDVVDLEKLEGSMQTTLKGLKWDYSNTITARITPGAGLGTRPSEKLKTSLDRVTVEVEGQQVPLRQVGQISMPNSQTLIINMASYPQAVEAVVGALRATNLNLNPIPDRNVIKVPIPKRTKEFRENLVKLAKSTAEKAKVGIRKARQKGISDARKRRGEVSADSIYRIEKHIQQMTDKHTKTVDELLQTKSTELMKGS